MEERNTELQGKFWVPGARKMIKSTKEKCVICKNIDKPRMEQQMGQLPDKTKTFPCILQHCLRCI